MKWLKRKNVDKPLAKRTAKRWFFVFPSSLIGFIAIAWLIGLISFALNIPSPSPTPKAADGIVALTGGDTRLTEAMNLLIAQKGQRVLISGVNPAARRGDILSVLNVEEKLFDCCVDLDRLAVDTIGNAVQSAKWIRDNNYHNVIIVTANYHMPRSLLEFRHAMPDIEITPYAIQSDRIHTDKWWKSINTIRFLASEYNKYIASFIRTRLF